MQRSINVFEVLIMLVTIGEFLETMVTGLSIKATDVKSYNLDPSWIVNDEVNTADIYQSSALEPWLVNDEVNTADIYQSSALEQYFNPNLPAWDSTSDFSYSRIDTPSYGVPNNEYPGLF